MPGLFGTGSWMPFASIHDALQDAAQKGRGTAHPRAARTGRAAASPVQTQPTLGSRREPRWPGRAHNGCDSGQFFIHASTLPGTKFSVRRLLSFKNTPESQWKHRNRFPSGLSRYLRGIAGRTLISRLGGAGRRRTGQTCRRCGASMVPCRRRICSDGLFFCALQPIWLRSAAICR
jgi:hypothetical protein